MVLVACRWCHELNERGTAECRECGHRTDLPRMACDCVRCRQTRPINLHRWRVQWQQGGTEAMQTPPEELPS